MLRNSYSDSQDQNFSMVENIWRVYWWVLNQKHYNIKFIIIALCSVQCTVKIHHICLDYLLISHHL